LGLPPVRVVLGVARLLRRFGSWPLLASSLGSCPGRAPFENLASIRRRRRWRASPLRRRTCRAGRGMPDIVSDGFLFRTSPDAAETWRGGRATGGSAGAPAGRADAPGQSRRGWSGPGITWLQTRFATAASGRGFRVMASAILYGPPWQRLRPPLWARPLVLGRPRGPPVRGRSSALVRPGVQGSSAAVIDKPARTRRRARPSRPCCSSTRCTAFPRPRQDAFAGRRGGTGWVLFGGGDDGRIPRSPSSRRCYVRRSLILQLQPG